MDAHPALGQRVLVELGGERRHLVDVERLAVIGDLDDELGGRRRDRDVDQAAAFAPVGGTGLVVLVATPEDAVDALTQRMIDRAKAFVWVPIAVGLFVLIAILAEPRRWLARMERSRTADVAGLGADGTVVRRRSSKRGPPRSPVA